MPIRAPTPLLPCARRRRRCETASWPAALHPQHREFHLRALRHRRRRQRLHQPLPGLLVQQACRRESRRPRRRVRRADGADRGGAGAWPLHRRAQMPEVRPGEAQQIRAGGQFPRALVEVARRRAMFLRLSFFSPCSLSSSPGSASPRGSRISNRRGAAGWKKTQRARRCSWCFMPAGRCARRRWAVSRPVPRCRYASLSKAVTGVCIATLIERGTLSPSRHRFRKRWRAPWRAPADPSIRASCRSLSPNCWSIAAASARRSAATATWRTGCAAPRADARPSTSSSAGCLPASCNTRRANASNTSNANYLMLGAIIEEAAGQPTNVIARRRCRRRSVPAYAMLDPAWRILSSYGGWRAARRLCPLLPGLRPEQSGDRAAGAAMDDVSGRQGSRRRRPLRARHLRAADAARWRQFLACRPLGLRSAQCP